MLVSLGLERRLEIFPFTKRLATLGFALTVVIPFLVACSTSRPTPTKPPTPSPTPTPQPTVTPTSVPVPPTGLLPHTFYYLGRDNAGLAQVFRIERDGITQHQLTFEPANVKDYDVSLADGSVAYLANNQLLWVDADGSNRRLLLDGGSVDQDNYTGEIQSPVFSPDAQTLAYGYRGLNLYALSSGESILVIDDLWEDAGDGRLLPHELYWPERYSPDGTRLLIMLGYWEGGSIAIYAPASDALMRLSGAEDALALICYITCKGSEIEWSADSSSFYSANTQNDYSFRTSALWKVDAASGAVRMLIPFTPGDGTINYTTEPFPGSDGQLYYFFLNYAEPSGPPQRPPLQLVRSAPDGVTGRAVLRTGTFELMNEALWAPDASFVIVAYAPAQDVYDGGQAEVVYLDARPNMVLTTFAQQMKWGP